MIPGGAHVQQLKRGDIIFNADQTRELVKYGRVLSNGGHGRVAMADGTAYNMMNAHVTTERGNDIWESSSNSGSSSGNTYVQNNYYGSSSSSSGSSSSSSSGSSDDSSTDSALEKFQDWFSQLFDWIEIRLERQTDKISRYIQKAENYLNSGRYGTSSTQYQNAINETVRQAGYEDRAQTKYNKQANKVLNKAVSSGTISKSQSQTIKKRVKNGSMNISEYSDEVQEVIKDYQEWYEKSLEVSSALEELNANIIEYTQNLKELHDTQRDAKIDTRQAYTDIGTSTYTSTSGNYYKLNNGQLGTQNSALRSSNSAYATATSQNEKDAKKQQKKASKKVDKAIGKATGKSNKKYRKALKSAQKSINKSEAVSNSDLNTIKKNSSAVYARLLAYNETLENAETARLEELTNYAANSADIYANTASQYEKLDDVSQNKIDLNTSKANNATSAKTANKYLDKAAAEYDTILSNDQKEIDAYAKDVTSNQKTIKNSSGTTKKLAKQDKDTQKKVQKYIDDAKNKSKQGVAIGSKTIEQLSKYASKGYVKESFVEACIDYNNALEHKREAEAQKEIDEQTAIEEQAAIGTQEFENVEQEYTNKVNKNQASTNLTQAKQTTATTRGVALVESDYRTLLDQNSELQGIYTDEIAALQKQASENISKGYWTTDSQEYLDAMNTISDYEVKLQECITEQEEYNNAIAALPYEVLEKALDLLDSIAAYNKSLASLHSTLGMDLTEEEYLTQIQDINDQLEKYEAEREQAWKDYQTALSNEDEVYGGKTADEWLAEYNDFGTTINGLYEDIEDLRDALRDDVYWRDFDRAHDSAQRFQTILGDISDLISDDMMFDSNGQLTNFGLTQVANYVKELENAREEVQNYSNDIDNLNQLYADGWYTEQEYIEKLNELQDSMLDAASSIKNYTDEIIDMYKQMAQNELDNLFELIDARNDALSAKKSWSNGSSSLTAGKPLEPYKLQRDDEKCVSVNVRKLYGLGNQQPSPEEGKAQRLTDDECSSSRIASYWRFETGGLFIKQKRVKNKNNVEVGYRETIDLLFYWNKGRALC